MATLKALAMAAVLAAAVPAHADPIDRWRPFITEASARFGVPANWIERVMRAESRGLTVWQGRPITSRAGAMGLMQLMPATWEKMRARLALGSNPHDPHDNIMAGTYYLRLMYDRFGYPGLFGAYNAGPGLYAAALGHRTFLPLETRSYLKIVAGADPSRVPESQALANAVFFILCVGNAQREPTASPNGLFAIAQPTYSASEP